MSKLSLFVRLEAKPGKVAEIEVLGAKIAEVGVM
jgi:hypothetical protein